jgi:hypothetical protein
VPICIGVMACRSLLEALKTECPVGVGLPAALQGGMRIVAGLLAALPMNSAAHNCDTKAVNRTLIAGDPRSF